MNYTLTNQWTALSSIIENYDSSAKYRIHVNIVKDTKEGMFWCEKDTAPTADDIGSFCDGISFEVYIDTDKGDTTYLKTKYNPVVIDVTEVA